ncbi:hypothetical protein SAMN04487943_10368 [Gracilibacillus orientalis]|uniref:Uncharacterized protein n=1 Tax=Gracilibacillus orientalis TaxID=334253 RepID=A0A1I4JPC2_9BACI|nr:hypothetical protein [Gracilibacillus orientalis]SFL67976.1 hypothetical protein SAMN04487943_10368 [Gracilibacillus orientalis]
MVIPGTDLSKQEIHFDLATEMGLWITHHHAEPIQVKYTFSIIISELCKVSF